MRNRKVRLLSLLLATVMLLGLLAGCSSDKGSGTGTVRATGNVNLRSGPGTEYERLATLPAGELLTVLEEVDDAEGADWSHVLTPDGQEGYVSDDYIYPLD